MRLSACCKPTFRNIQVLIRQWGSSDEIASAIELVVAIIHDSASQKDAFEKRKS